MNIRTSDSKSMALLAAARSHTNYSARNALRNFGLGDALLDDLDQLGYLVKAGNEWRIEPALRRSVLGRAPLSDDGFWREIHEYYYASAKNADPALDPSYLSLGPGRAYHGSEIEPESGVLEYGQVALIESLSVTLDADRMAREQVSRGVINANAVSIEFLRGMALYRSGSTSEAVVQLRAVALSEGSAREVAVAQHLVARWDCMQGGEAALRESRKFFKSSRKYAVAEGDIEHQAHVEHSEAICMLSRGGKQDRAVILLRHSLKLTQESGDRWGEAKVLHTLGQALSKLPKDRAEARRCLEKSKEIGVSLGFMNHVDSVERSLLRVQAVKRRPKRRRSK